MWTFESCFKPSLRRETGRLGSDGRSNRGMLFCQAVDDGLILLSDSCADVRAKEFGAKRMEQCPLSSRSSWEAERTRPLLLEAGGRPQASLARADVAIGGPIERCTHCSHNAPYSQGTTRTKDIYLYQFYRPSGAYVTLCDR